MFLLRQVIIVTAKVVWRFIALFIISFNFSSWLLQWYFEFTCWAGASSLRFNIRVSLNEIITVNRFSNNLDKTALLTCLIFVIREITAKLLVFILSHLFLQSAIKALEHLIRIFVEMSASFFMQHLFFIFLLFLFSVFLFRSFILFLIFRSQTIRTERFALLFVLFSFKLSFLLTLSLFLLVFGFFNFCGDNRCSLFCLFLLCRLLFVIFSWCSSIYCSSWQFDITFNFTWQATVQFFDVRIFKSFL